MTVYTGLQVGREHRRESETSAASNVAGQNINRAVELSTDCRKSSMKEIGNSWHQFAVSLE